MVYNKKNVNNILYVFLHISVYPFTFRNRVNRYFTPLRSRQSVLTHSIPSDKMTCPRQLIFRLSLRSIAPHSVHFATCHHLNYKSTTDKLILFI